MSRSAGSSSGFKMEGATAGSVSISSMGSIVLFQGACNKNGIKLSVSSSSDTPSIHLTPPGTPHKPHFKNFTPSKLRFYNNLPTNLDGLATEFASLKVEVKKLTEFPIFGRLPVGIRRTIWRWAMRAVAARTVLIQPYHTSHPELADVCMEARIVFLEEYGMRHSRQVGRMSGFSMSISYDKDLLYLNRRFSLNPKQPYVTPLHETAITYKDWLKPVQQLAINLKDTQFLMPRAWGYNLNTHIRDSKLWEIISTHCPELRLLCIVDDEAVELGTQGDLLSGVGVQPNRSYAWNIRWFSFCMGLRAAKMRRLVRQDLVLKAMDADKVVPQKLPI
ncbi:hypothetical protein BKA65DRAFT_552320 [Rhexocercosporidium sp. MPI-PUGE-AT-0058]|nr:hypothetical protein BKA65DRAFT_552320 [Rhexocercosporidium sp. MPI-PUGE-AT-0058]